MLNHHVLTGAVKQIVLKVSQEVPENAWRKLQDLLHYYTHTTDGDEAALTEMDKRHDELPVREKTYQMLRAWRRAALEGATCRLLIKALQEIRLSDVASEFRKLCDVGVVGVQLLLYMIQFHHPIALIISH